MRLCRRCDSSKEPSEFYAGQSKCKTCSKALATAWNKANPSRVNANSLASRRRDPQRSRGWEQARFQRDKAKRMALNAAWRAAHPGFWIGYCAARRARKRAAIGGHSAQQRRDLHASYGGRCAYCRASAEHLDHVTSLARGGCDHIENIVPACGPCNRSKGTRSLLEFLMTRNVS